MTNTEHQSKTASAPETRSFHVVQNGNQIDIHEIDYRERREITIATDLREKDAHLLAKAPAAIALLIEAREFGVSDDWKNRATFIIGDNVQEGAAQ